MSVNGNKAAELERLAQANNVPIRKLGATSRNHLVWKGIFSAELDRMTRQYFGAIERMMEG